VLCGAFLSLCLQLLVIATKGSGTRALDMAVKYEGLRKEGVLLLEELSMRGSSLSHEKLLDGSVCSLWGRPEDGGDTRVRVCKCIYIFVYYNYMCIRTHI